MIKRTARGKKRYIKYKQTKIRVTLDFLSKTKQKKQ